MDTSRNSNPGGKRSGGASFGISTPPVGRDDSLKGKPSQVNDGDSDDIARSLEPGKALMDASRKRRGRTQLGTAPRATGATINGASTSTSRIGY